MSVAPGRMPGIDAIAEGGGTSDTVAFATAAPSLFVTRPLTDDVCAEAAAATNRMTTLVTATRNLCIFITLMTSEGSRAVDVSDHRVVMLDRPVDIYNRRMDTQIVDS